MSSLSFIFYLIFSNCFFISRNWYLYMAFCLHSYLASLSSVCNFSMRSSSCVISPGILYADPMTFSDTMDLVFLLLLVLFTYFPSTSPLPLNVSLLRVLFVNWGPFVLARWDSIDPVYRGAGHVSSSWTDEVIWESRVLYVFFPL